MTVITRQRSDKFAIVPNAIAEDDRISFEARGMLVYLLAKPNDWEVRIGDLQRAGSIGRDKAYRILGELIDAGYVTRSKQRRPGGTYGETEYVIYDDPVPDQLPLPRPENPDVVTPHPEIPEMVAPLPEKPHPAEPYPGNQDALIRTHSTNTQITKTHLKGVDFGELWRAWPREHRPESHGAAQTVFLNLQLIDRQHALALAPTWRRLQLARRLKPRLLPFLKSKAWQELIDAPPFDSAGDFVITPDREEWQPWLDAIRGEYGDSAVRTAISLGKILRKDRWPPISALAKGHQLSMRMD